MLKAYTSSYVEEITEKTLEYNHEDGCGYAFDLGADDTLSSPVRLRVIAMSTVKLTEKSLPGLVKKSGQDV